MICPCSLVGNAGDPVKGEKPLEILRPALPVGFNYIGCW